MSRRTAPSALSRRRGPRGTAVRLAPPRPEPLLLVVLERDPEPDAELGDLPAVDRHVLANDLGDSQVTHGLTDFLDGVLGCLLPRIRADADNFGHSINAVCHLLSLVGDVRPVASQFPAAIASRSAFACC